MSVQEKAQDLVDTFGFFTDWMEKYEHLIELGKELPLIEEQYKTDDYRIQGCQSQVWLHAREEDGAVFFTADSDAIITKGIIALLLHVLNGEQAEVIRSCTFSFIDDIGLHEHLSPTRSNGLLSMIKQIQLYAATVEAKNKG